jgi:putative SOS response-associated peptidase YedK
LVAEIHDRMPLIIAPSDYERWLSDDPDPGDLMWPFPAEPIRMWPISTRVDRNWDRFGESAFIAEPWPVRQPALT